MFAINISNNVAKSKVAKNGTTEKQHHWMLGHLMQKSYVIIAKLLRG